MLMMYLVEEGNIETEQADYLNILSKSLKDTQQTRVVVLFYLLYLLSFIPYIILLL